MEKRGIIEELLDTLRSMVRIQSGRNESPSMGIIDSRNVKTSHHVDSVRGLDGNKKIKGRKQHIIVDSQGYLMSVAVQKPMFMTARVLRRSLRGYPTNFLVLPKSLRMVAIEEALQIGYLTIQMGT